jgi:two-component sensor histidine kinase
MGALQAPEASVAAVFINDELRRRVPKKTDYLQEKLALQDLASRMADRPDEVLPRFVDLAMEIAGGVSAGLSLYEEDPAPGVFRWHCLRGTLAPFVGATTPRNFSPCGVTLDLNAPVLSSYPERVYTWIADAQITVPEVLLVPLYIGGSEPLGTLWIVSDRAGHFDAGHARVMTELAAFVGIALHMQRTEQRLQQALDEQQMLAKEMSHRVKNLFAVTDGMIRVSAKTATTKDELALALSGRLHALARADALVRRNVGNAASPSRVSELGALTRTILAPHQVGEDAHASRFTIEGPALDCGERATNGLALVLHELATNAVKYGALHVEDGHVDIGWRKTDKIFTLRWVERGGPPIETAPAADGFGSVLAKMMVVQQLGGTLDYDWAGSGLSFTITLPVKSLST